MVGALSTAFTVKIKFVEVVLLPSLTVTVIVADPSSPAAGEIVIFLDAPLPPKEMFASGTSV